VIKIITPLTEYPNRVAAQVAVKTIREWLDYGGNSDMVSIITCKK